MSERKRFVGPRDILKVPARDSDSISGVIQSMMSKTLMYEGPPLNIVAAIWPGIGIVFADFVIKLDTTTESPKYRVETVGNEAKEIDAGTYFTILNSTEATLRLSFWDDNQQNDATKALSQFQLPELYGAPAIVFGPLMKAAVSTFPSDHTNSSIDLWIHVEEEQADGSWIEARGGGNGADMRIKHP